MSREDIEAWRASIEDIRAYRGEVDWEGWLARAAELWDPEIEWDASELPVPDIGGIHRGREAVRGFWRGWLAAWGTLDFDYELVDAGDQIVMLVEQQMSGRFSGIETPLVKSAQVATFRNGRMVRWKLYASQSDALKAVGLTGPADDPSAQAKFDVPSEGADLVRRAFAAWNRGDIEGWLGEMHPEIQAWGGVAGLAEGREFHGLEGMRRWWADFHDAFDEVRLYADEVRDLGERVLVLGRIFYRGKASGIEQERPWGWAISLCEGRGVRVESYDDPNQALVAVGITK
jgi:ketosteroid isomerase-like protein